MTIVVDASVFIEAERRHLDVPEIVALVLPEERLTVASIAVSELLVGMHLADTVHKRREREDFVERIVNAFPVLAFDVAVAGVYAEIWAHLRSSGNLIPPHDLMIGATALHFDFQVLTHNLRHFARIPGLRVIEPNW